MKAAVYERYGGPDVIEIREVPTPTPKPGEVLVRVRAASVNSWDWDLLTGNVYGRLGGLLRPRQNILGADMAGEVEGLGEGARRFAPGDAVVGDISGHGFGGFAEYVSVPETALVPKPASLSFEAAAAVPQAGLLALQALRKRRPLRPGESILINGAGGGSGTFAIQLARLMGAEVTAVDRGHKLDLMRSLGADRAVDYMQEDVFESGQLFDRIVDPVARRPMAAYRSALAPDGTLVVVGGRVRTLIAVGLAGLGARSGRQHLGLLIWRADPADMTEMLEMCAAGTITPAIDRMYPLAETGEALRRVGEGLALGKVVVQVADSAA